MLGARRWSNGTGERRVERFVTITRRTLFVSAAAGVALGARNWDRAFPDWTDSFVDKMLTDSPWARSMTLPFRFSAPPRKTFAANSFDQIGEPLGLPKGWPGSTTRRGSSNPLPRVDDGNAPPVQTEIYLTSRWATALPVRQALVLHQYGKAGLQSPAAEALLRGDEKEYVFEVAGFPVGMVPQGVRRFEAELLQTARLSIKGRKPLAAAAASVPEHGTHLMATLRFPRFENLSGGDGLIEFSAQAGPMDIHQKFKLHDMNYQGRLEL